MTTNQTKQFCQSNLYWQLYLRAEERCDFIRSKIPRYISAFTFPFSDKKYDMGLNTMFKNNAYWRAHEEFKHKFGAHPDQMLITVPYPVLGCESLRYGVAVRMNSKGEWMVYFSSSGTEDGCFNKMPFINDHVHNFRYEGVLSVDAIIKACQKELDRFLYPKGYLRTVQEYNLWTKDLLKTYLKRHRWPKPSALHEDDVCKWIKRHFNIDVSNVWFEDGVKAVNKYGRQDSLKILRRFDYSFMYYLEGDIDECENAFWEEMDNYEPNCILI